MLPSTEIDARDKACSTLILPSTAEAGRRQGGPPWSPEAAASLDHGDSPLSEPLLRAQPGGGATACDMSECCSAPELGRWGSSTGMPPAQQQQRPPTPDAAAQRGPQDPAAASPGGFPFAAAPHLGRAASAPSAPGAAPRAKRAACPAWHDDGLPSPASRQPPRSPGHAELDPRQLQALYQGWRQEPIHCRPGQQQQQQQQLQQWQWQQQLQASKAQAAAAAGARGGRQAGGPLQSPFDNRGLDTDACMDCWAALGDCTSPDWQDAGDAGRGGSFSVAPAGAPKVLWGQPSGPPPPACPAGGGGGGGGHPGMHAELMTPVHCSEGSPAITSGSAAAAGACHGARSWPQLAGRPPLLPPQAHLQQHQQHQEQHQQRQQQQQQQQQQRQLSGAQVTLSQVAPPPVSLPQLPSQQHHHHYKEQQLLHHHHQQQQQQDPGAPGCSEFAAAMSEIGRLLEWDPDMLLWALLHANKRGSSGGGGKLSRASSSGGSGGGSGGAARGGRSRGRARAERAAKDERCAAAVAAVSALIAARARLRSAGAQASAGEQEEDAMWPPPPPPQQQQQQEEPLPPPQEQVPAGAGAPLQSCGSAPPAGAPAAAAAALSGEELPPFAPRPARPGWAPRAALAIGTADAPQAGGGPIIPPPVARAPRGPRRLPLPRFLPPAMSWPPPQQPWAPLAPAPQLAPPALGGGGGACAWAPSMA